MGCAHLLDVSLFLRPWNGMGHCHLHVLFHADCPWYLLFITATTEIPALWSYDIIERKVAQSSVETMNYFEFICNRLQELLYFPQVNENVPRQTEFLVVLWALWHLVWELNIQTLQILRRPYLIDEGFTNCSWMTLQPTSFLPLFPNSTAHTLALLLFRDLSPYIPTSGPLRLLWLLPGMLFFQGFPWLSFLPHSGVCCSLSTPNTLIHFTRLQRTHGDRPAILSVSLHLWGWLSKTNLSENKLHLKLVVQDNSIVTKQNGSIDIIKILINTQKR